jgi:predicted ATPase with chaperone activity
MKVDKEFFNDLNFSQIIGQELTLRAIELAAAGNHNILLIGPPGMGKTLIARTAFTIMPERYKSSMMWVDDIHFGNEANFINWKSILDSKKIMMLGTSWPCLCGYYGDPVKECNCSIYSIRKLKASLSYLVNGFDIIIETPRVPFEKVRLGHTHAENSDIIKARVKDAESRQWARQRNCNAWLDNQTLLKYSVENSQEKEWWSLLNRAYGKLGLSVHDLYSILSVSRTIADLAGRDIIECADIAEACQYKTFFGKD